MFRKACFLRIRQLFVLTALAASFMLSGCGKSVEAVITSDGEDITLATKEYAKLPVSTSDKFSFNDLKVGGVTYLMTESQVVTLMGQPVLKYETSETAITDAPLKEKVYSYNDLTLVFTQIDTEYRLTAAATTDDGDVFSRGLSVGDTFDDILKAYYRDENYQNNYYFSEDKTTVLGKFLYGNYTIDSLESAKIKTDIEYGLVNYNGYTSLETAESYIVEFTYFKAPYKGEYATVNDAFAQIDFDVDYEGKITSIRWYYYPQLD